MITYISLLVGMCAAIAGVLLKPRATVEGKERFNRWIWLFLLLPILAFGVSAADTYKRRVDSKAEGDAAKAEMAAAEVRRRNEGQLAEDRRRQEARLAEQRRRQEAELAEARRRQEVALSESRRQAEAAASQARLALVQGSLNQSINRVSYLQASFSWRFRGSELSLSARAKSFMRSYLAIYTEIRRSGQRQIYGFSSAMFDNWRSASGDEREFFSDVESALRRTATAAGGEIFIDLPGSQLLPRLQRAVSSEFGFPRIRYESLGGTTVRYPLVNPRQSLPTPPLPTISAQWDWVIPDKDSNDPEILVSWIDRVISDRSSRFIARDDYRGAEIVIFAPRPNPDLDDAPSLGAYRGPMGQPASASVNIGGMAWSWTSGNDADVVALWATFGGRRVIVGYLIRLRVIGGG